MTNNHYVYLYNFPTPGISHKVYQAFRAQDNTTNYVNLIFLARMQKATLIVIFPEPGKTQKTFITFSEYKTNKSVCLFSFWCIRQLLQEIQRFCNQLDDFLQNVGGDFRYWTDVSGI